MFQRMLKNYFKDCCTINCVKNKFPIIRWLPKYRREYLYADIIAGLTVALMLLPQALAYAHLATLPPQFGLYSSFMGCFVYIFLGTSKDITLGPTALMSLLTAEFCSIAGEGSFIYAVVLCLITGCVQLAMGILQLGILVEFISHPVISGFTTSAAIIIAWGQVKYLLGLKHISRDFIQSVIEIFKNIGKTNFADLGLGVSCLVMLVLLRYVRIRTEVDENPTLIQRISRGFLFFVSVGKNAVVVVAASLVAYSLNCLNNYDLSLTEFVTPGLPPFEPPIFEYKNDNGTVIASTAKIFSDIGVGFIIVPFLGIVEAMAIGQTFARENSYRIDSNQELMGIGVTNILGSFVTAYPVTGSFSRTAVNSQSGVRTPLGGVVTGLLVIVSTSALTAIFQFIPQASLAAVIIVAVMQMTDFSLLISMWHINKLDILPWLATFVGSIVLGVQNGILIGVGVSFLFLLYTFARMTLLPSIHNLGAKIPGRDLMFPARDFLECLLHEKLLDLDESCYMLDLSAIRSLDYSVCHTFALVSQDFLKHDKKLILITPNDGVRSILRRTDETLLCFASPEDAVAEVPEAGHCLDENTVLLRPPMIGNTYDSNSNCTSVNDSVVTIPVST